jgi:small conductance mechanosensitive channel
MVFGIGYADDIDKARDIIVEILSNEERILKDPAPQVAVSELADSSVNFVTRPWVNAGDYWGVVFDVTEAVKKRFDAEGISIPFPQRDVHLYEHKAA